MLMWLFVVLNVHADNQGALPNGTNVDPVALLASYQAFLSTATDTQVTAMQAMLNQLPATNHPSHIAPNVTSAPTTTTPVPPTPNIGNQEEAIATPADDDESDNESKASNLSDLGAWANNTYAAKTNLHSNDTNHPNTTAALTLNAF